MIVQDIRKLYGIKENAIQLHAEELARVLKHRIPDISVADVARLIDTKEQGPRDLRICIASYGFTVGGGEIIPIEIANALRTRGHHVTFLALMQNFHDDIPVLRHRLRNDIPVVYWDEVRNNFQGFLNEYGIELINSHNFGVEYFLYCSGTQINIPYISSLHGGYESVEKEFLTADFIAYVRRNVNEWLYLSEKNIIPLTERGLNGIHFTKSFNALTLRPANAGLELRIRQSLNAGNDSVLLVLASRALHEKDGRQRSRLHKDCGLKPTVTADYC